MVRLRIPLATRGSRLSSRLARRLDPTRLVGSWDWRELQPTATTTRCSSVLYADRLHSAAFGQTGMSSAAAAALAAASSATAIAALTAAPVRLYMCRRRACVSSV